MTIGTGNDQIDLYYFGRGHTNGDTLRGLQGSCARCTSATSSRGRRFPMSTRATAAASCEQPKSLAKAVATVKNVDTIINGHIPVSTWNDLKEYAQFTSEFRRVCREAMKAGKTADQAADEYKLDPKFKGYVVSVNPAFGGARANIDIAYNEMKK